MPVSANILRLLAGEAPCDETPIREVATYQFLITPLGPRYKFHGFHSISPAESQHLTAWHHSLLGAWNRILSQRRRQ
jgi:hypothetical protein